MARIAIHAKTPIIEYKTANNRLQQIICKAHFAVWCNLDKHLLSRCAIVEQHHSRYVEEHHREILPHIEQLIQTLINTTLVFQRDRALMKWQQDKESAEAIYWGDFRPFEH